jgi:hypothetical protein
LVTISKEFAAIVLVTFNVPPTVRLLVSEALIALIKVNDVLVEVIFAALIPVMLILVAEILLTERLVMVWLMAEILLTDKFDTLIVVRVRLDPEIFVNDTLLA